MFTGEWIAALEVSCGTRLGICLLVIWSSWGMYIVILFRATRIKQIVLQLRARACVR